MNLQDMYDFTLKIQKELEADLLADAEDQLKVSPRLRRPPDYKIVRALAAAYDLQEYFAGRLSWVVKSTQDNPDDDA